MNKYSTPVHTFSDHEYSAIVCEEPAGFSATFTTPDGVVRKEYYLFEEVAVYSARRWVVLSQAQ